MGIVIQIPLSHRESVVCGWVGGGCRRIDSPLLTAGPGRAAPALGPDSPLNWWRISLDRHFQNVSHFPTTSWIFALSSPSPRPSQLPPHPVLGTFT